MSRLGKKHDHEQQETKRLTATSELYSLKKRYYLSGRTIAVCNAYSVLPPAAVAAAVVVGQYPNVHAVQQQPPSRQAVVGHQMCLTDYQDTNSFPQASCARVYHHTFRHLDFVVDAKDVVRDDVCDDRRKKRTADCCLLEGQHVPAVETWVMRPLASGVKSLDERMMVGIGRH